MKCKVKRGSKAKPWYTIRANFVPRFSKRNFAVKFLVDFLVVKHIDIFQYVEFSA